MSVRTVFIVLLFASLVLPRAAFAEAGDGAPRRTEMEVSLHGEVLHPMTGLIEELLARHEVRALFHLAASLDLRDVVQARTDASRLGYVWLEVREAAVVLYVADATAERVLVRSVDLQNDVVDEVVFETVAHIIEAAVDALVAGTPIGRARADVERELGIVRPSPAAETAETPSEPSPPEPDSSISIALGAGYGARYHARAHVQHGPAVHVEVRGQGDFRFGGRLSVSAYLPIEETEAQTRFIGGTVWLDALLDMRIVPALAIGASLGAGVDLHSVSPSMREAFTVAAFQLRAGMGLLIEPPEGRIAFRVDAWAALDPTDLRYVVRSGGESVIDPFIIQASGRLSLLVRL